MQEYFNIYFNLKQHFLKVDFLAFSLDFDTTQAIYDGLKNRKVYEIGLNRAMKNYHDANVFEKVCVANILFNPKFFISDFFSKQEQVLKNYEKYRKISSNPDYFIALDEDFLSSFREKYDIMDLYQKDMINFYTMLKFYTQVENKEPYKKMKTLLDKFIIYRQLAQERTQ